MVIPCFKFTFSSELLSKASGYWSGYGYYYVVIYG